MEESIRIIRIEITKLFGHLNYDIDLDNGEDIAVLIGPNGSGKTTLFNFIDYAFSPYDASKYERIENIPFDSFTCTLSNGNYVRLIRAEKEVHFDEKEYTYLLKYQGLDGLRDKLKEFKIAAKEFQIYYQTSDMSQAIGVLDLLKVDDAKELERYLELLLNQMDRHAKTTKVTKQKYTTYLDNKRAINEIRRIHVKYIRADRLHSIDKTKAVNRKEESESSNSSIETAAINTDTIRGIKNDSAKRISELINEYNFLQTEKKDSLPRMYLQANTKELEYQEFKTRWLRYVDDIEKFYELGLIKSNQTILELESLEETYKKSALFLTVYLDAFEDTLTPLKREYPRLKLFADIISSRHKRSGKSVKFTEKGVCVIEGDKELPLDCLSSGEMNDFVMFYNLVFFQKENGIILIDEPEISLHINWQEEYLDRLMNICEMNGFQAIVATHSPNIINGHFELMAERKIIDDPNS